MNKGNISLNFLKKIDFSKTENDLIVNLGYPVYFIFDNTLIDNHNQLLLHCNVFKQVFGEEICVGCEKRFTNIIQNIEKFNSLEEFKKEVDNNISKIKRSSYRTYKLESKIINDRVIVEFDCPILGYRKVVFPIIYNNSIIGVMLMGQISLINNIEKEMEIRENFIKDNINLIREKEDSQEISDLFIVTPFIEKMIIEGNCDDIIQNIHKSYKEQMRFSKLMPKPIKEEEYNELLTKYINELKSLEDKIYYSSNETKIHRIQKNMNIVENYLLKQISDLKIDIKGNDFWNKLDSVFNLLCSSLMIKKLVLFANEIKHGDKKNHNHISNSLVPIIKVGTNSTYKFENGNIRKNHYGVSANTDYKELNSCIVTEDNDLFDIILYCNMFFSKDIALATIVTYKKKESREVEDYREDILKQFISNIYSIYTSVINSIMNKNLQIQKDAYERRLKVTKHELAHHNEVLYGAINNFKDTLFDEKPNNDYEFSHEDFLYPTNSSINKSNYINSSSINCIRNAHNNMLSVYYLIDFSCKNSELFDGKYKIKRSNFWFLKDIVYKCYSVYERKLSDRALLMDLPKVKKGDKNSPAMYNDRLLVELVFNNLIDNAAKYAHTGTKIFVRYNAEANSIAMLKRFQVINYGFKEADIEELFEFYCRGDIAIEIDADGQGIGLAICKKIIDLLGGDISFRYGKRISKYNIGYIKAFIDYHDEIVKFLRLPDSEYTKIDVDRIENLKEPVEEEYKRIKDNGEYARIVNQNVDEELELKEHLLDIIAHFEQPTYEVKLTVYV